MVAELKFRGEEEELKTVLSSAVFGRSQNLAKILQYVCDRYFENGQAGLSEYGIAVEALGRQASFDPTQNAAVRVEFHRLREKLQKYYETAGADHSLKISFHPGSYSPIFARTQEARKQPRSQAEVLPSGARPEPVAGGDLPPRPRRSYAFQAVLAVAVLGALVLVARWKWESSKVESVREASAPASQPRGSAAAANNEAVRIAAGYTGTQYIDRAGKIWGPDRNFKGGEGEVWPRHLLLRTVDPTLYQTGRTGTFSYHIPLRPGIYELHLYFAEQHFGPGDMGAKAEGLRIYSIRLNGQMLLESFDPIRDAGGPDTVTERVFKDISPAKDGLLHLEFIQISGNPLVNAIEIVPGLPGKLRPVRMVEQPNCLTDSENHTWEPSRYFRGGADTPRGGKVEGTTDPDLYDGERFGNFDYEIPVATGRYTIKLYFAEAYLGTRLDRTQRGGASARVFDVYCNGHTLLRNFDIFKEAGGANRALVKSFHGLEPDGTGKLRLEFVPVKDNACVNAVEVVNE